jgi:hypothetical protein
VIGKKLRDKVYEPVRQVAAIAIFALCVAVMALIAAVARAH